MNTEELISSISTNLAPVRRYYSPWTRTVMFLGFAAVLAVMVAFLHNEVFEPSSASEAMGNATLAGALLSGILAALAAFMIGQPGRSRLWALLPLPALALWLGSMGYQCLTNWVAFGPEGMSSGETAQCFATLFVMAVPLILLAILMLRNMARLEPNRIALLASLAVAGITAAAMDVFHPADASLLILVFNLGTALSLLSVGWLLKRIQY